MMSLQAMPAAHWQPAQVTTLALTTASWADPRTVERGRNVRWCVSPRCEPHCMFRGTAIASGRVLRKGIAEGHRSLMWQDARLFLHFSHVWEDCLRYSVWERPLANRLVTGATAEAMTSLTPKRKWPKQLLRVWPKPKRCLKA